MITFSKSLIFSGECCHLILKICNRRDSFKVPDGHQFCSFSTEQATVPFLLHIADFISFYGRKLLRPALDWCLKLAARHPRCWPVLPVCGLAPLGCPHGHHHHVLHPRSRLLHRAASALLLVLRWDVARFQAVMSHEA